MSSKDQDFAQFAVFALVAALVAAPFTAGFSILGVGIGLLCLRDFMKRLP